MAAFRPYAVRAKTGASSHSVKTLTNALGRVLGLRGSVEVNPSRAANLRLAMAGRGATQSDGLASSKTLACSHKPKISSIAARSGSSSPALTHRTRPRNERAAATMLKTLLAAALLITLIKLLLWCTAPLRSSRDTALDEDARKRG